MSKKKGENGADPVIEILRSIRDEIGGLRIDTNHRFERLEQELQKLEGLTAQGFEAVGRRLEHLGRRVDNLVDLAGEHHRELAARLTRLEGRVDRLEGGART